MTVSVYESWSKETPLLIGWLHVDVVKGKDSYSFEYNEEWLRSNNTKYILDPELEFYGGRQYASLDKKMFGIFSDSAPDRWGRKLLQRRENIIARKEGRKPHSLSEIEYMLGVYDEARMGALRFSVDDGEHFLSDDNEYATPPWVSLRKLEAASLAYEMDEAGLNDKWLSQLIAPGSSLGGARPKATVEALDNSLWIAKFPSKNDDHDVGAWEMVVHDLALSCGLNTPEARLERFSKNGSTFLTKRFDRDKSRRIHFSSAMTMLGKTDGDDSGSYLDMAEFIKAYGASPQDDLKEMWKRIVFNMAVSNTDDHLRNHGFILTKKGWRLSPVYDINPVPYGDRLSLNVDNYDNAIDLDLALSVSGFFGLDSDNADKIIHEILKKVSEYKVLAKKYGISRSSIEYMEPAFLADRE